jgi:2-(1,2-epoxy-1,2-dihydrophenyl)acetyl-CoA isomerase
VRWITINRPERKNAINGEAILALKDAIVECAQDEETRVVVFSGAGSAFSSGADLRGGGESPTKPGVDLLEVVNEFIQRLWDLPKPVIAAVGGVAAGVGCSLALASDIRLASERARFSLIFVQRGLTMDGGATYFLPRLAGLRGMEMALTGDIIDAEEAFRLGLVNRIISEKEFGTSVAEYAERLAKNAPLALASIKTSIHKALTSTLGEALAYEATEQRRITRSEDVREGMAAFLEKRDPVYKGR